MELHKISRRSFLEATALSGAAAVFSHPLSGGLVSTASAAEAAYRRSSGRRNKDRQDLLPRLHPQLRGARPCT